MREYKIQVDATQKRREKTVWWISWAVVALLLVAPFVLRASGGHPAVWFAGAALAVAVIASYTLAAREALRRAEREMVFVLDDEGISRKRRGYADIHIPYSQVASISQEMRWLIIRGTSFGIKIAVPDDVSGIEAIRTELAQRCPRQYSGNVMGTRSATAFTVAVQLLPYIAGGCLVLLTHNVSRLAVLGILITLFCTVGAYVTRRRINDQYATQRLVVDPFLYAFEFAFTAVLVHYLIVSTS